MSKKVKTPRIPALLDRKIYKTGQTRGADDDVIYQNRVGRNSTVLIPYAYFDIFLQYCLDYLKRNSAGYLFQQVGYR